MVRVIDNLETIVHEEVADYNRAQGLKSAGYFFEAAHQQAYAWVVVPHADHPQANNPQIVIMARISGQYVVIEQDTTDRPLVNELQRRGIPRDNIILAYAGETLPHDKDKASA